VVAVEEPFALQLADHLPEVQGRIDLIERLADGRHVLTDFKTAKSRRWLTADQLVLYREAARALGLAGPERLGVRYVLLLKTASPSVEVLDVPIAHGSLERLISTYRSVWQDIERGASSPRPGWQCRTCQWARYCVGGAVACPDAQG